MTPKGSSEKTAGGYLSSPSKYTLKYDCSLFIFQGKQPVKLPVLF